MQSAVTDEIHQTIFLVDPPAPQAAEIRVKRLRLSDALKGMTFDVLEDHIDPFQRLFILHLPIQVILPSLIKPVLMHSQKPRSTHVP